MAGDDHWQEMARILQAVIRKYHGTEALTVTQEEIERERQSKDVVWFEQGIKADDGATLRQPGYTIHVGPFDQYRK